MGYPARLKAVMRARHIAAAVWVTLAAVQSSFLHFHREHSAHEHGGLLHTHLARAAHDGATLEEPAEASAPVWLDWAVADPGRDTLPEMALPSPVVLPLPEARAGVAPVFVARSHDPPFRPYPSNRAPPR